MAAMSSDLDLAKPTSDDRYLQYRSVSAAAITTLIVGVLSLGALVFLPLIVISLVGILLGLYAVWQVRRRGDELTGMGLARTGLALSALTLVGGGAFHWAANAMEIPEGYANLNFWELRSAKKIDVKMVAQAHGPVLLPLPEKALEMDGQKVFIKGYVFPHNQRLNLKTFVLVPDMGTCCFGGQPALTDMIEVTLADPLRIDFSYQRRGVGGILRVHRQLKRRGDVQGVVYELAADYVH